MRRYWVGAAIVGLIVPFSLGGVAYAGVGNNGDGTTSAAIIKGDTRPGGIPGQTCGIRVNPNPDPNNPADLFQSGAMQAEVTPGNRVNFVCQATVDPGTIAPFNQSGFVCHLGPFGDTYDSHVVWTKSGQGTLTCHGTVPTSP